MFPSLCSLFELRCFVCSKHALCCLVVAHHITALNNRYCLKDETIYLFMYLFNVYSSSPNSDVRGMDRVCRITWGIRFGHFAIKGYSPPPPKKKKNKK